MPTEKDSIADELRAAFEAVLPGERFTLGPRLAAFEQEFADYCGAKHGIGFQWQEFPWSCDWYKEHGRMCPEDAPAILRQFDAIYFGAVGNPAIVPDHVSAWGLLINFRRWFDLYVNSTLALRPCRVRCLRVLRTAFGLGL